MGISGEGDRPLFDESSLTECSESTGRPAWIPGTDDLVHALLRLRRVHPDGGRGHPRQLQGHLRRDRAGRQVAGLRPPDRLAGRHHRRVPRRRRPEDQGGHPVRDRPRRRTGAGPCSLRRASTRRTATRSSRPRATCSCWRATTALPEGADPADDVGSEVLAARIVDDELDLDNLILVSGDVAGDDDDPTFSPDGTQIVYTHSPPADPAPRSWSPTSQGALDRLRADPDDRRPAQRRRPPLLLGPRLVPPLTLG